MKAIAPKTIINNQPNCPSATLQSGCTRNIETDSNNSTAMLATRVRMPGTISSGHNTSAKIANNNVKVRPTCKGSSMCCSSLEKCMILGKPCTYSNKPAPLRRRNNKPISCAGAHSRRDNNVDGEYMVILLINSNMSCQHHAGSHITQGHCHDQ